MGPRWHVKTNSVGIDCAGRKSCILSNSIPKNHTSLPPGSVRERTLRLFAHDHLVYVLQFLIGEIFDDEFSTVTTAAGL